MPLTLGGGVKNETDVEKLFEVEQINILNSIYYDDKNLLKIISKYGNQSIVFSLVFIFKWKTKFNSKRGITKPLNIEKLLMIFIKLELEKYYLTRRS